ncbi:MAG: pentapeptide repeat-containing protein [Oceanospirillaceae bacterium]|nr:pentapeptide repeat-containing protein [Oceanospirillaceae bacterium]
MKSTIYSGQHVAHQCSMPESSFDDVNLFKSTFNNVNLAENHYSNINLANSTFYDVNLSKSVFNLVNLSGAKFTHIGTSSSVDFNEAKVDPVIFEDADLTGSRFSAVNFTNAQFSHCVIDGLIINGVDIAALMKGETQKPALKKIGWLTHNDTGSVNKISKNHFMPEGAEKTLCGVEIPAKDAVAQMSSETGSGVCKRCANIKKSY